VDSAEGVEKKGRRSWRQRRRGGAEAVEWWATEGRKSNDG
jgi:hypothetical protein